MSWDRDASPRALTIEVIAYLVPANLVVLLSLNISTQAKLLIVLVLAVLASLNFVAFVGLLERWKRRRETSVRERSIRRHPDLVSELYQLHDRIETVVYRRAADKPSLALNVVEIMNVASPSNPNGPEDFREKFEMVQRQSPYGTLSSPASAVGGTGVIMRRGRFQNGSAAR